MHRREKFFIFTCLFGLKQCPFSFDLAENNWTFLSKAVITAHATDTRAVIVKGSMSIESKEAKPWFAPTMNLFKTKMED